jgi:glutathione peroxidase-family protein
MFDKKDIDDTGEIPAPFCLEKYNFNPNDIIGDCDKDKQGKPVIKKDKKGRNVDKKGRQVNRKGFLADDNGHLISRKKTKKFDKKQLTPDGDLPKLLNYDAVKFDAMDTVGDFDQDNNGKIVISKNKKGEGLDKNNRKVNSKGYLIDEDGNIISKNGKKLFDSKHLKNGEYPKIFPFTRFNIKNVLGEFEPDPLNNPILKKHSDGTYRDDKGQRVNARGYLIDAQGNVIDKKGKIMFEKILLDSEGEIPKVFTSGLLKSDSASSISRLMSEIEKN